MQVKLFQKFGDLKVVGSDDRSGWRRCECKCGKSRAVREEKLLSGKVTACVACTKRRQLDRFAAAQE